MAQLRSKARAGAAERPPPSPNEAIDVALRYLAARPRSEHEVRRRLRRTGLDDAAIDTLLGRLRSSGLVDDAAFAEYWVEQRQTFRPRGARLLAVELRQHGVSAELASAAAEPADASAEDDAYRAGQKRASQLRALDERTFRARLGQTLARRGFDWDTITRAVDRLWLEVHPTST